MSNDDLDTIHDQASEIIMATAFNVRKTPLLKEYDVIFPRLIPA